MAFITTNPQIDLLSEQQPSVYYLDDGTAIFKGIGDPNGVIFAGVGSLFVNSSGQFFQKTTSFALNTGWNQVSTIPVNGAVELVTNRNITVATTSGTGTDVLQTITIQPNTWDIDGRRVTITAQGAGFGAAGTKRILATLNGLAVFNTGLQAGLFNDRGWYVKVVMTRLSSDTLIISCEVFTNAGLVGVSNTATIFASHHTAAGLSFAISFSLDFFGECSVGSDTLQQYTTISSVL